MLLRILSTSLSFNQSLRYVLEREAKLEERRSRSVSGSRSNLGASRSSSFNAETSMNRASLAYQRAPSVDSNDFRTESNSRSRKSRLDQNLNRAGHAGESIVQRGGSSSRSIHLSKERPVRSRRPQQPTRRRIDVNVDEEEAPYHHSERLQQRESRRSDVIDREKLQRQQRDPDPDADKIDERLAKLQHYLQTVLK